MSFRACLKTTRGAAARDFGCGQSSPPSGQFLYCADREVGASPQRAATTEPTQATDKRPAVRRVFGEKAVWPRCSSVEDPQGVFSLVAPCHTAFSPKTAPLVVFKQALRINSNLGMGEYVYALKTGNIRYIVDAQALKWQQK